MIESSSGNQLRFEVEAPARMPGLNRIHEGTTTLCSWLLGLMSVAFLSKLIPVTDYLFQGTRLTLNVLPFTSVFLLYVLILFYNLMLGMLRETLGLTRQDLVSIICMTMVANHIPGHGLLPYLTAEISSLHYISSGYQFYDNPSFGCTFLRLMVSTANHSANESGGPLPDSFKHCMLKRRFGQLRLCIVA